MEAQAGCPRLGGVLRAAPQRRVRLLLLQPRGRREGSLAAALLQSMALAVISTAGAYPSWVLVTGAGQQQQQVVLGASWAISQADPPRGSALLGPSGGPLMLAIALCCLLSVVSGSSAVGVDFLGRRRGRRLGPLLHGLTALLTTCAAALGSSLLVVVRGRARSQPALQPLRLSATPGQSLFLSFLACALASTATGLSCSSPALVAPARSSRDVGRVLGGRLCSSPLSSEESTAAGSHKERETPRGFDSLDTESGSSSQDDREQRRTGEWLSFLQRELPGALWKNRSGRWSASQQQQPVGAEEGRCLGKEAVVAGKFWVLPPPPPPFTEDALHASQPREKETELEDPGRGDAELQLTFAPDLPEKPPETSESRRAVLAESQARDNQDSPAMAI